MSKPISFLLVTILTLGMCFTACDNGTTSDATYSYAPLVVTGKDFSKKDVIVTFTTERQTPEEGQTLSKPETDDSYSITLDEEPLSEGAITVSGSGSFITFIPKSGKRFSGTLKDDILRFTKSGGGGGGGGGRHPSGGNPGGIPAFTVSFYRNDGTGTVHDKVTVASTTPASALGESFPEDPDAREGYIFSDWNTAEDGSGEPFTRDTPVDGTISVFARWTKTYTVTFMLNYEAGGEFRKVIVPSTTSASGLETLYPEDTPLRPYYTWVEWNTAEDGKGDTFTGAYPVDNDISVFARWKPHWRFVSAGNNHTLAIDMDGYLWAWGENEEGQLGLGDDDIRYTPTRVGDNTWLSVSAGQTHSLAIDTDENLWAWGQGYFGELGLGGNGNNEFNTPTQVEVPAVKWKSVSAGHSHSLAIDTAGNRYAWGGNTFGQLGLGDTFFRNTPTRLEDETDTWLSVSASSSDYTFHYSAGVTTAGILKVWGSCNRFGQPPFIFEKKPTQVGSDENWASVSANTDYIMAVKDDGSLWAWGKNIYGKLGLGDTKDRPGPVKVEGGAGSWTSVSLGGYHTLAIDTAGNLWAWGHNSSGQLGFYGSKLGDQYTPDTVKSPATTWTSVSAGENHSMAIDTDGKLWAWGENGSGQLGLGDDMPKQVKTPALVP